MFWVAMIETRVKVVAVPNQIQNSSNCHVTHQLKVTCVVSKSIGCELGAK